MGSENGGPAFPTNPGSPMVARDEGGMCLLDWFAGQALVGLLATPDGGPPAITMDDHYKNHAALCYGYARAMIAERAKSQSGE